MDNSERNFLAKSNGDFGEKIAPILVKSLFGEIRFIDDIIDYVSDSGIFIEIKTCQHLICSANPNYPFRTGRFILEKSQHTYLKSRNGYYVFLVKSDELIICALVIPADKIQYSRAISWKTLFKAFKGSGDIIDTNQPEMLKMPVNNDCVTQTINPGGD